MQICKKMDKVKLKVIAGKLEKPSWNSYNNYVDKTQLMINYVSNQMKADPRYKEKVGDNEEMIDMNLFNHTLFMSSIFLNFDAGVFIETILWSYRTYMARGVQDSYWLDSYNTWLEVIEKQLSSSSYNEISSFYKFMHEHHHDFLENAN